MNTLALCCVLMIIVCKSGLWAMASFCYESWGKSVREVEEEVNAQ